MALLARVARLEDLRRHGHLEGPKPVSVRVAAGRYKGVVPVRSTLSQSGFPFGSGTRTSYFAPGKGLVKLVFKHKDGSVSTVERVK